MGIFGSNHSVLSDNILIKKNIYDPLALNYIITTDDHNHLLNLVLNDITSHKAYNLFLIEWSSIPFDWHGILPKIKDDLVSNIFDKYKIFNWKGVIGNQGVEEKLKSVSKSIEDNPEYKHIASGPRCSDVVNYLTNSDLKVIMYVVMLKRDYMIQDLVEIRNNFSNKNISDFNITLILTTDDSLLQAYKSELDKLLSKGKTQKLSDGIVSYLESTV